MLTRTKSGPIINADDYGIDSKTNDLILQLAERGKINSVSCFSINPPPSDFIHKHRLVVGLHLDLTFNTQISLIKLMLNLLLKSQSHELIKNEFERQLQEFVTKLGFYPRHIDSHQNVHQLYVVRDALREVLNKYIDKFPEGFYIRCTDISAKELLRILKSLGLRNFLKNYFLMIIGRDFKKFMTSNRFNTNRCLFGTYRFRSTIPFHRILNFFLGSDLKPDDLIYCHPGYDMESSKSVTGRRYEEFLALMQIHHGNKF